MKLNGLIQHSFALQVPKELRPRFAREGIHGRRALLRAVFETPAGADSVFLLGDAGMQAATTLEADVKPSETHAPWRHSIIVDEDQTEIAPFSLPFEGPHGSGLPTPLSWAEGAKGKGAPCEREPWRGFVFGGDDKPTKEECNDFLLEPPAGLDDYEEGVTVSRFLCQLLAHRRSQIFGLALARNTFNVFLPHAMLDCLPVEGARSSNAAQARSRESRKWLAQPAVCMFYVEGRRGFRPIFSFSLFLVPCKNGGNRLEAREMCPDELHESVKTVWPLATATELERRLKFKVSGPLGDYLSATSSPALASLNLKTARDGWKHCPQDDPPELSLRQFAEATLFALAAQVTRGPGAPIGPRARRILGDRVITSLSASRVSSVVLVPSNEDDGGDAEGDSRYHCGEHREASDALVEVATAISRPLAVEKATLGKERCYRLDHDLFDRPGYEIAVLPADRCLITLGSPRSQTGVEASALSEVGRAAFMASGAAAATGLIRNIFREITFSGQSRPDQIAQVEREAMIDLHETYDIEITSETYRHHYRQLRDLLGITDEYKALSRKLEALHRESSTRFEDRSEQRLTILTWAIMLLSAVIAAGTLILIFKGG